MTVKNAALLASYWMVLAHLRRTGGADRPDWIEKATGASRSMLRTMARDGLLEEDRTTLPIRWRIHPGHAEAMERLAQQLHEDEPCRGPGRKGW